jgi:hypothetical protein
MFRKSAYDAAGGYRAEFGLAQDWDLWWRLSEIGLYAAVPDYLYTRELSPSSISFQRRQAQQRLGEMARELALRRRHGQDETPLLARAGEASRDADANQNRRGSLARGLYFIGSLLRDRGDDRARIYFRRAIAIEPWNLRAWARWMQSLR